tara:strand:- start:542 stop:1282 length:741 start_codon:yes stop_codon:yes gene_type:complete
MINKIKYWFLSCVILTLFCSCGKDSSCLKGTGKIIKEQRVISADITHIDTQDNIDIIFTQSNNPNLTVEGGGNLLPFINTDILGNRLTISSDNKCSMFRDNSIPITVYLSLPNINRIDYRGKGDVISTNTLNASSLDVESRGGTGSFNLSVNVDNLSIRQHSGPADFTFTGSVNNSYIYTLGNGWFYLNYLITNNAHVNNSGTGDVAILAVNSLLVELTSIGNINYLGNPVVTISNHSGGGKLIKK